MHKISSTVLKAIFQRRGENGKYTKPFDEFDFLIRNYILSTLKLADSENPALAGFNKDGHWFLITDERLFFIKNDIIKSLKHTDIKDASFDFFANFQLGMKKKEDISLLKITTFSGEKLLLMTEPGKPCIGILNIIKTIAGRNKK